VSEGDRGRRALGLDLGERRIGVAISDSAGVLALPLCTIERTGDHKADHAEVIRLVDELGVGVVVVGLPRSLDGRIGPAARAIRTESEALTGELAPTGVNVVTHDERFTTVEADRALRSAGKKNAKVRRRTIDQTAAAVLLQAWLATGARG
jgi:putative holliday junction resolvase